MSKIKALIIQPMTGRKKEMKQIYEKASKSGADIIVNLMGGSRKLSVKCEQLTPIRPYEDEIDEMHNLGATIIVIGEYDFLIFADGWRDDRECRLVYEAAMEYGIMVIEVYECNCYDDGEREGMTFGMVGFRAFDNF